MGQFYNAHEPTQWAPFQTTTCKQIVSLKITNTQYPDTVNISTDVYV